MLTILSCHWITFSLTSSTKQDHPKKYSKGTFLAPHQGLKALLLSDTERNRKDLHVRSIGQISVGFFLESMGTSKDVGAIFALVMLSQSGIIFGQSRLTVTYKRFFYGLFRTIN